MVTVAFGSNKRVHALPLYIYIYIFEYCVMASSSTLPPPSKKREGKDDEKREKKKQRKETPILVRSDVDQQDKYQIRRLRAFGVEAELEFMKRQEVKEENEKDEKKKEKEVDEFGVEEVKEIEPPEPPEGSVPPGRVDREAFPEIYERMKPAKGPFLPGRIN